MTSGSVDGKPMPPGLPSSSSSSHSPRPGPSLLSYLEAGPAPPPIPPAGTESALIVAGLELRLYPPSNGSSSNVPTSASMRALRDGDTKCAPGASGDNDRERSDKDAPRSFTSDRPRAPVPPMPGNSSSSLSRGFAELVEYAAEPAADSPSVLCTWSTTLSRYCTPSMAMLDGRLCE